MKLFTKLVVLLAFVFTANSAFALVGNPETKKIAGQLAFETSTPEFATMNLEAFLEMTPSKFEELTGKKLGLKETVKMKFAQKKVAKLVAKKPAVESGVYVLLAILGFGWIAMGLNDDWNGSDWIVNLILTLLCWLPGLIHALTKKSKWY